MSGAVCDYTHVRGVGRPWMKRGGACGVAAAHTRALQMAVDTRTEADACAVWGGRVARGEAGLHPENWTLKHDQT